MPGETLTRSREYTVASLSEIPRGEGRSFVVAGERVAVFRTHRDEVFASQADCPHLRGPLADGMMGGTTIVCPLHEYSFDLRTGQSLGGDCAIKVYAVRQEADGALVLSLEED